MTRVYGASDDLIEFEGDVVGEVGHYSEKPCRVTFSDGTVLSVCYGKPAPHDGVWWVRCIKAGPLFDGINECFDENADPYSDVATFREGLTGARCKGRQVQ